MTWLRGNRGKHERARGQERKAPERISKLTAKLENADDNSQRSQNSKLPLQSRKWRKRRKTEFNSTIFFGPSSRTSAAVAKCSKDMDKIAAGTAEFSKFLGHPPSGTLIQQRHFVHVLGGLVAPVKQLAPLFLADIFCQVGLALLLGSRADEPKLGKETGKCI